MKPQEFAVKKNIKDLEYNKTLNLITTYTVILATIILTISLSEILTPLIKLFIILSAALIMIFEIIKLKRSLDLTLDELKKMK